jgi:hypothetical protein
MFQELCIYVVTSYLLLKEKCQVVSCIYLNDSKLLKVIADKNKINIVFSYIFQNIIFIVTGSVYVMVCVYLAETQAGFRFSQFPPFEIGGVVAFIFYS